MMIQCFIVLFEKKQQTSRKHMIVVIFLLLKCLCSIDLAQNMFNIINSYRLGNDLKQLNTITNLDSVAKEQALYMCENRNLTHENPIGGIEMRAKRYGYTGAKIKENIAKTKNKDIEEVAKTWMSSEKHRKNILGKFAYSGVGTCLDKDGNRYWVQIFGSEKNSRQNGENYSDEESDTHSSIKSKDSDTNENPTILENEPPSSREKRKMPPAAMRSDQMGPFPNPTPKTADILSKLLKEKNPECLSAFQSLIRPVKRSKSVGPSSVPQISVSISTKTKTSYIPISSVIYKTYTRTIFNDITKISSVKEEMKPPQTIFMVLPPPQSMMPVITVTTSEKSIDAPPIRSDSVVSQTHLSTMTVSTVYVTIKEEPKTTSSAPVKSIFVTETVKPSTTYPGYSKTVTVTVSKEQSASTPERTVTVTVSSEQTVSVTSSSHVPITKTINIERVVTVRVKPMAKRRSPSTELYSYPSSAHRDNGGKSDTMPENNAEYQDSEPSSNEAAPEEDSDQPEIPTRPKIPRKRSTLKHSRITLIRVPKKNTGRNHRKPGFSQVKKLKMNAQTPRKKNMQPDGQYFIENMVSSTPDYSENEDNSFINNPCGTRDNPCIRQVFIRE